MRDLQLVADPLGCGAYGEVFRGRYHGQDVAVKIIKASFMDMDDSALDDFEREATTLRTVRWSGPHNR